MEIHRLDTNDLLQYVNNAYHNILRGLLKENYLTEEQVAELMSDYSVIIESKSWLPECVSSWLGLKEGRMTFRLVKAIGRSEGEET